MQISPLSLQVNSFNNFNPSRKLATHYYNQENVELNINYSDQNYSVNLSLSSSVTYIETTYTENGFMVNLPISNFKDIAVPPRGNINTGEVLSESDPSFDEDWRNYLELIRNRIEYLLIKTAEESNRIASSSRIGSSNIISDLLDFSPEKTAERIIDFALSFYDGGDRQQFAEMVKKAVMKGFNEAMKALGGFLPQECYETIGKVNRALDDFACGRSISFSA